jgi:hypothetical protein
MVLCSSHQQMVPSQQQMVPSQQQMVPSQQQMSALPPLARNARGSQQRDLHNAIET